MAHSIKLNRAIKQGNFFKGSNTVSAIVKQMPDELLEHLTAKDISIVLETIDKAYKFGRASAGAEMIDSNAVWINGMNRIIEWDNELNPQFK